MTDDKNDEPTQIDLQLQAIELKNEVLDLVGGQMHIEEADDIDPAIAVQFWENVAAYEKAPRGTLLSQLEQMGLLMPPADTLGDELLSLRLWEVLDALVQLRVFLEDTDHLSDRELYTVLLSDLLTEEVALMPGNSGFAFHTSPIGSGSEEDMQIYHRYYASEESRLSWLEQFPDDVMPPRETPPYDRDSTIQQRFAEG
jgi:hypothetical protein